MEKEQIKENLSAIPEIKQMLNTLADNFKAYFSTEKPAEVKEEAKAETPKETPAFDFASEFKKITEAIDANSVSIDGKFKAYDEKFSAIEADLNSAKEIIGKQDELLKKTNELIQSLPSAFSSQKPKETVKPSKNFQEEVNDWFTKYSK